MDMNMPVDMKRASYVSPKYSECIIELRTASEALGGVEIERVLREEITKRGLVIKLYATTIDLGVWPGSIENSEMIDLLRRCYERSGVEWRIDDPQYRGFIDVQMLAKTIASPTYVIGAGGVNRHGANEYVSIDDLSAVEKLYQMIIQTMLGE